MDEVSIADEFIPSRSKDKINITFIGAVRHYNIDKKIVDIFGNDSRYKILFHGYGVSYTALNDYCDGQYDNVFISGKYERKDKTRLLRDATIINSYYASGNYANRYALPNKYYDTLLYRIPLWANPNVYVGKRSIERGIGINVILNSEAPDNIYLILDNFDWNVFNKNCSQELERILNEDKVFVEGLHSFILL